MYTYLMAINCENHMNDRLTSPIDRVIQRPHCTVVSWWRHQMEAFPRYWPFVRGIHRWPVNSPHKGQWRGTLMLSLICAWINGWVNNRDAGDLRRRVTHCDVIVMYNIPTGEAAPIRVYIVSGLRVECNNFQPALHRQELVLPFRDSFYTRSMLS